MSKRIEDFIVSEKRHLTRDIFILEVSGKYPLQDMKPGQFVQTRIDGSPETFLRRPLSVHDIDYSTNTIKLLVQIAGNGTRKLSEIKKGENLNLIYPLGNSFSLPEPDQRSLLIGGGCGVAPLLFLGKYLRNKGFSAEILLGFRNSERIIEFDEYKALGTVYLTTEDGSKGEKGFVTDHSVLQSNHFDRIYCCGPNAMMKAVAGYAFKHSIDCEVSLENLMACGIGVCLCCVVETVRGNTCTCTDGPVFNIKELKW